MKKILVATVGYITCDEHLYFLKETIQSVNRCINRESDVDMHTETAILYNKYRGQDQNLAIADYNIFNNRKLGSVSECWNEIVKLYINDYDYIIICNSDIVMNPRCVKNLVKFAIQNYKAVMWTASEHDNLRTIRNDVMDNGFDEHPHFSCFMINKNTIDKIGYFDINYYPAYFEDQDYHQRILLTGEKAMKTGKSKFYHFGSRTIKCDDKLNRENAITYEKCRKYFQRKWGYDSHSRAFTNEDRVTVGFQHPFGNKNISIKEWDIKK